MPRAVRPVNARVSAVSPSPAIASRCAGAVAASGQSMNAVPSCGGRRAEGEHGRDRAAGGDAARGDQRQVDGGGHELEQREQADLAGRRVVEAAAVPARLDALHDQRVGARGGGRARLGRRRHRHPHGRVRGVQGVDVAAPPGSRT